MPLQMDCALAALASPNKAANDIATVKKVAEIDDVSLVIKGPEYLESPAYNTKLTLGKLFTKKAS